MSMYCVKHKKFFASSPLDSCLETYCSVFSLKLFQGHCLIFTWILKSISFKIPFKKWWKCILYKNRVVFDYVMWEWYLVFLIQILKQFKILASFTSMYSFSSLLSPVRVHRYAHAYVYSRNLNKYLMYVQFISKSGLKLSWLWWNLCEKNTEKV